MALKRPAAAGDIAPKIDHERSRSQYLVRPNNGQKTTAFKYDKDNTVSVASAFVAAKKKLAEYLV
jgi:hypothetical protein